MDGHGLQWTGHLAGDRSANPLDDTGYAAKAEGEGFEPSTGLTTRNGFRDRRIRPLCHPSGSELKAASFEAEKEGFEPSREEITPLTP